MKRYNRDNQNQHYNKPIAIHHNNPYYLPNYLLHNHYHSWQRHYLHIHIDLNSFILSNYNRYNNTHDDFNKNGFLDDPSQLSKEAACGINTQD